MIRFVTQAEGFSEVIIDRFFRPFLGGIFFDNQLRTSSRLTSFVMRMLATGSNCLPAQGIGAITEQLASRLPPDSIRLGENLSQKLNSRGIHLKCSMHAQRVSDIQEGERRITLPEFRDCFTYSLSKSDSTSCTEAGKAQRRFKVPEECFCLSRVASGLIQQRQLRRGGWSHPVSART